MKHRFWILLVSLAALPWCSFAAETVANANSSPAVSAQDPNRAPVEKTEPDVIFVPTPQTAVDKMLEMAELKPGDVLYDLGCGDGRICVTAAKKYGVTAVGFDIDPQRIDDSMENVRRNGVGDLVTIKKQDIFTVDCSQASVITLYLLPSLNVRLLPQLEKMKPGSRVISYSFDMAGVEPAATHEMGTQRIYKWIAPLKKEKE